jgi:dienelactone hydrolase
LPVVAVGYSWGAKLVTDYAVKARRWGPPPPRGVMSVFQPDLYYGGPPEALPPKATRVVLLSGDSDCHICALAYRDWLVGFPRAQREEITIRSRPGWVADHDAPARSDRLTRLLIWKRLDDLVRRVLR